MTNNLRCRCGHSVEAHEHFRAGSDCSACDEHGCRRFSARRANAGLTISAVVPALAWNRFRVHVR